MLMFVYRLLSVCVSISVAVSTTDKYTKSKEGSKTDPLVNKQPAKVEETKVKEVVVNGEDKSLNAKDKLLARMAKRGDRPGSKQNKMKQNKLKQKETP